MASADVSADAGAELPAPPEPARRPGSDRIGALLEVGIGLAVALSLAWLSLTGWRFYDANVRPIARVIPTVTATAVVDPAVVRQEARRMREVADHVGAGIAFRQGGRPDLALKEFMAALALDPANFEARQSLKEMGVEVAGAVPINTPIPPTPTIIPTATPRR